MKILMVARWPVGGIRTFLRDVFANDAFADCQIRLLAPGKSLSEYFARYIPRGRFEVRTVDGESRELLRMIATELRQTKYEILHSHGLKTGLIAEIARGFRDTRHILSVHDVFLPETFAGMRGRINQFMVNVVASRCHGIHAVGQDCAENFKQHMPMVRRDRVHAIVNGIDTDRYVACSPIDARQSLGLSPETALVGFFGRFMAQKGFRALVDAVALMLKRGTQKPFRVITFGEDGFVREDYAYIEDEGLRDSFIRLPYSDEPECWMKAVDVIAMPSRWEACPLQPMEGLVAGVPFVGTDCIGLREVLSGSPAWVVPVNDPAALAEALADAIENPRMPLFEAYRATAIKRFDVSICARKLRQLYGHVLNVKGKVRAA